MSQDSIQLLQPVTVKVIMTSAFRANMIEEVRASLAQIEENLQRLELIRGQLEGPAEAERLHVESEKVRLHQAKDELHWRIREAESVVDGAELFYQKATCLMTVRVGDDFVDATRQEILVRDGKVVEIRSGGGD